MPPLALAIAWLRRKVTLAAPAVPDARGLLLTFAACLLYLAGTAGAEYFLLRISLVVLAAGLILTFWGMARLRTLAFPLLILAAMVPLPNLVYRSLTGPLQLFASETATAAVQALGLSVHRQGNVINLAGIALGVEDACSGLNSLAALMVASLLLGYLFCSRLCSRTALFVLSIPLSIAVNVLRVVGTAILADYREEFAMGFYHSFAGWLVFVLSFGGLYAAARQLQFRFEPRGRAV